MEKKLLKKATNGTKRPIRPSIIACFSTYLQELPSWVPDITRLGKTLLLFMSTIILAACGAVVDIEEPVPTGQIQINWEAPTTNEDGSPLMDLSGFKVFIGLESGHYFRTDTLWTSTATSYSISALPRGVDLYFCMTAFDAAGNDSIFSSEVNAVISEE